MPGKVLSISVLAISKCSKEKQAIKAYSVMSGPMTFFSQLALLSSSSCDHNCPAALLNEPPALLFVRGNVAANLSISPFLSFTKTAYPLCSLRRSIKAFAHSRSAFGLVVAVAESGSVFRGCFSSCLFLVLCAFCPKAFSNRCRPH